MFKAYLTFQAVTTLLAGIAGYQCLVGCTLVDVVHCAKALADEFAAGAGFEIPD
jgi:hypothetical protein